jgi:hypothetical protein
MESPQETVARLIEARENEPEEVPEVSPEGVVPLTEVEKLTFENLTLKQELLKKQLQELTFYMTDLENEIRDRLHVSDGQTVLFNRGFSEVEISKKE